ncbi:MAG: hypothetical protein HY321_11000 [Armatimonadetes bacterium]|nr:hypothetical protein [Armatimonadota bacterium]
MTEDRQQPGPIPGEEHRIRDPEGVPARQEKDGERDTAAAPPEVKDSTAEFEAALAEREARQYVLRLYVTGTTPRSRQAIENLRRLCEEHLQGRYQLEVVDIYQQPDLAGQAHILAAPTLIKQLPLPLRRFVGDLSDKERILAGLEIKPAPPEEKDSR